MRASFGRLFRVLLLDFCSTFSYFDLLIKRCLATQPGKRPSQTTLPGKRIAKRRCLVTLPGKRIAKRRCLVTLPGKRIAKRRCIATLSGKRIAKRRCIVTLSGKRIAKRRCLVTLPGKRHCQEIFSSVELLRAEILLFSSPRINIQSCVTSVFPAFLRFERLSWRCSRGSSKINFSLYTCW